MPLKDPSLKFTASRRTILKVTLGLSLLLGASTTRIAPAVAADGGTLVMATSQVPRHFNGAVQSGLATAMPSTQIFASPLRYDDNWNPKPYLAESWKSRRTACR